MWLVTATSWVVGTIICHQVVDDTFLDSLEVNQVIESGDFVCCIQEIFSIVVVLYQASLSQVQVIFFQVMQGDILDLYGGFALNRVFSSAATKIGV